MICALLSLLPLSILVVFLSAFVLSVLALCTWTYTTSSASLCACTSVRDSKRGQEKGMSIPVSILLGRFNYFRFFKGTNSGALDVWSHVMHSHSKL